MLLLEVLQPVLCANYDYSEILVTLVSSLTPFNT